MPLNIPPAMHPDRSPLLQEGWERFLRLHEPTASATELDEYERWKERSTAHLEVAREIEDLWISMDSIPDLPWPTAADLAKDNTDDVTVSRNRRRWIAGAALAASLVLATSYFLVSGSSSHYATGRGEHRLVNLPDGSELIMGAMSAIEVDYSASRRQLWQTKGEVLFTVSEDPARPFVVETPAGSVRAVGTAFNINAMADVAVISVVKGIIRVELDPQRPVAPGGASLGSTRELSADQQISLGVGQILEDVHSANSEDVLGWRSGRFVYSGAALSRVIEDVNRYADTQVKLGDRAAGELLFTGAIQCTQFDSWLSSLE
ncbi:MAG: hypothetical protein RLZZ403_1, partial [Pseudomonadota bacterium]